jgi:hypothetical protein
MQFFIYFIATISIEFPMKSLFNLIFFVFVKLSIRYAALVFLFILASTDT